MITELKQPVAVVSHMKARAITVMHQHKQKQMAIISLFQLLVLAVLLLWVFCAPNSLAWMGVDQQGESHLSVTEMGVARFALVGLFAAVSIIFLINGSSDSFIYFVF